METRLRTKFSLRAPGGGSPAQAPHKPVIPAQAGIQGLIEVDSRSLPAFAGMTGDVGAAGIDGLKEAIHPSLVRNQVWK